MSVNARIDDCLPEMPQHYPVSGNQPWYFLAYVSYVTWFGMYSILAELVCKYTVWRR